MSYQEPPHRIYRNVTAPLLSYIMKFSKIVACVSLAVWSVPAMAGDVYDDMERMRRKAFDGFERYRQEALSDFEAYRSRVNAEFAEALAHPWMPFRAEPPDSLPVTPPLPPVVPPDPADTVPFIRVIPDGPVLVDLNKPRPAPVAPLVTPADDADNGRDFTYYGTRCKVKAGECDRFTLRGTDEKAVSEAWQRLSDDRYYDIVAGCLYWKRRLGLCDWGYYKFVEQLSRDICGSDTDDAVVLTMFVMAQSGYKARIGRKNDRLVLLMPFAETVYGYMFTNIGGDRFYLLDKNGGGGTFYVFDCQFPGEQAMSVALTSYPEVAVRNAPPRKLVSLNFPDGVEISINANLMDFLNDYPVTDRWDLYAAASLAPELKESLYPVLRGSLDKMQPRKSVNMLLEFVQHAFEYKTDQDQFGYERPLFGDESCFYPYNDCEDRAIFFAILVRELLDLDVVLLDYPGHIATAIRFQADCDLTGDKIVMPDGDYIICDPTYIGAFAGMCMPQYKTTPASVIRIGS